MRCRLATALLVSIAGGAFLIGLTALASPPTLNPVAPTNALLRELLARDFSSSDLSYLSIDLQTGAQISSKWSEAQEPIPIGSLVKPFLAVAYAEAHGFRFPEHKCLAGTCWLPRGHGQTGIVRAIAISCNSYFTSLAQDVSVEQVSDVAHRFGLSGPPPNATPEGLAGQHGEWRESPAAISRAYAELLSRREQPGITQILDGMRESARNGTGAGISRGAASVAVLTKTGTAPCTHTPHAPGDGFVVAAWPADAPKYLLLLRAHGHPGAQAAASAGRLIHDMESQP